MQRGLVADPCRLCACCFTVISYVPCSVDLQGLVLQVYFCPLIFTIYLLPLLWLSLWLTFHLDSLYGMSGCRSLHLFPSAAGRNPLWWLLDKAMSTADYLSLIVILLILFSHINCVWLYPRSLGSPFSGSPKHFWVAVAFHALCLKPNQILSFFVCLLSIFLE